MRPLLVAVALPVVLAVVLAPSPAGAAGETPVGFGLPPGPAVAGPHVEGQALVDGSLRITVAGESVRYVGRSGPAYVVVADDRVLRVEPDATTRRLARAFGSTVHLSADGDRLVVTHQRRAATTTVTVRSAATGARVARRELRGYVSALAVDSDRVLVGGQRRTVVWRTGPDTVRVLAPLIGYEADLAADVVAAYESVPSPDATTCTRVLRVSTGRTLSRLCDVTVLAFNPDASRIVTTGAYLDGPVGSVSARTLRGRVLAHYRSTRTVGIGETRWESRTALLLGLVGEHRSGTARCTAERCELAGATIPSP